MVQCHKGAVEDLQSNSLRFLASRAFDLELRYAYSHIGQSLDAFSADSGLTGDLPAASVK